MKWKILIVLMIFVLSFTIFLSSSITYFSDDGGGTNNTNSKNPQTAVVLNVQYQHFANYKINLPAIAKRA